MASLFAQLPEEWPLLAGMALVAVLLAESAYLLLAKSTSYRKNVNRRLAIQGETGNREEALLQLKRERGLDSKMSRGPLRSIMGVISQTGLAMSPERIFLFWAVFALTLPLVVLLIGRTHPGEIIGAIGGGLLIPLIVLKMIRGRRIKRFGEQFPEAIDIVVRSLKAGHPLPIAITLVAREMADPVGTEFGLVSDELSFGLELEAAMRNLYARVGQEDIPLFVTSVSIQASTGGNLAAVLSGLSSVIRDRFRMRRKITALSSEARFSAYVLISLPFLIYLSVSLTSPDYFEITKGNPLTTKVVIGSGIWMSIGVAIMRKLVNMKI